MAKFVVLIPTKNEGPRIAQTIHDMVHAVEQTGHEVSSVLITDDSKDDTREVAKQSGAEVVNGGGRGLGYAMFKGLKAASKKDCDFIVTADGDGQTKADEFKDFFNETEKGADLVLGSRFQKKGLVEYNYSIINRTGVRILASMMNYKTKLKLTDSHGGLRIYSRALAEELEMIGHYTYVQETIIDAVEKGYTVHEIPSAWKERLDSYSRVLVSIPRYVYYTLPVLIYRLGLHKRWLIPMGLGLMALNILLIFLNLDLNLFTSLGGIFHLFQTLDLFILGTVFILFSVLFEITCNILRELRRGS
jgi:glycosyltransferase involved in cell wall biosynthesis